MSAPEQPDWLAEIKARHAATGDDVWTTFRSSPSIIRTADPLHSVNVLDTSRRSAFQVARNASFCAHAHQDVPRLIAEVDRLRAENATLRGYLNDAEEGWPRDEAAP